MSLPFMIKGMAFSCMGVASSNPIEEILSMSDSSKPNSVNFKLNSLRFARYIFLIFCNLNCFHRILPQADSTNSCTDIQKVVLLNYRSIVFLTKRRNGKVFGYDNIR